MARVSIEVEDKLLHMLKIHTAYTKSNIKDFVTKAIVSQIEYEKGNITSKNIPNAETVKAFEETDLGINFNKYSSWQEMIDKTEQEIAKEQK